MTENSLTGDVIDAAYRVHRAVGPGLLESVYERLLVCELEQKHLKVARQEAIPIRYGDVYIATAFFADLIVEDRVIIEVKSVDALAPVHKRQLLTYLRLADKRVGLLINFNVVLIKDGIVRVANGAQD